jgi:predicted ATPase
MSIQSVTLKNYRSFVERTTIELRPLTLLFGYNNSGKSALLRALPLIADSLSGRSSTPIDMESPALRESSFSELLSRKSQVRLEIELSLADASANNYHLNWTILDMPELKTHIISQFSAIKNGIQAIEAQWSDKSTLSSSKYDIQYLNSPSSEQEVEFNGLLPEGKIPLFEEIKQVATTRLQWLTAVRTPPPRNNPFRGAAPKYLQPDGQGVANMLAYDNLGQKTLLSKVSNWYEEHYKQRLLVDQRETFQIVLQPSLLDTPYQINILDVGEGVAQVLPVLVACAMASEGKIDVLAIEEPESHLHPRLQMALAAHFCELARQVEPPKMLLETHSEQVLLRVQLEIAQGKLDPNLVLVYWVHQLEDGRSVAEKVTFDELGRPQGKWPRNMFYEAIEQSRQLVQTRRERSKL